MSPVADEPVVDEHRRGVPAEPLRRYDRAKHLLVRQLAVAGSDTRLADLAVACGYFDQAHLAREFRSGPLRRRRRADSFAFPGRSPTAF
jgi:hypothetical protein